MHLEMMKKESTCMDPECAKLLDAREARGVCWRGRTYFYCCEVEAVQALQRFQASLKPPSPMEGAEGHPRPAVGNGSEDRHE